MTEAKNDKMYENKEWLQKILETSSHVEAARIIGCDVSTIGSWVNKHDINLDIFTCRYCEKIVKNRGGLTTHEKWCNSNNEEWQIAQKEVLSKASKHKAWNKGLSKYNNESLRKLSENYRGENHHAWKGGKCKSKGYIKIYTPEHPNNDRDYYVLEHRLVMEKHLGRYLTSKEHIHHLNGVRNDNRLENLFLYNSTKEHIKASKSLMKCGYELYKLGILNFDNKNKEYIINYNKIRDDRNE